jgi:hypothetical protein
MSAPSFSPLRTSSNAPLPSYSYKPSPNCPLPSRHPSSLVLIPASRSYILNRQPGKALPYFLRLREPHVFSLIREHNLFTDVQDQALLLVEFDEDLRKTRSAAEKEKEPVHGTAIGLLVDHTHSIPVHRALSQFLLCSVRPSHPKADQFCFLNRSLELSRSCKTTAATSTCTSTLSSTRTLTSPSTTATCRYVFLALPFLRAVLTHLFPGRPLRRIQPFEAHGLPPRVELLQPRAGSSSSSRTLFSCATSTDVPSRRRPTRSVTLEISCRRWYSSSDGWATTSGH